MERYKLVRKSPVTGMVTLINESSGETINISESSFRESFTKLKDAVIKFVKDGGKYLVKIGSRIADGVNSVINSVGKRGVGVQLCPAFASAANEAGLSYENNFDEFLEACAVKEGKESGQIAVDAILELGEYVKMMNGKLHESSVAKPGASDDIDGLMGSRIQKSNGDIDKEQLTTANEKFANGKALMAPTKMRSQIPHVSDFTRDELIRLLNRNFGYIFNREITSTSAIKRENEAAYKPFMIFGAAGIGKTEIIKQIKDEWEEKLGRELNFVHISATNTNKYSFASPATSDKVLYKRDDDGKIVRDSDGNPIVMKGGSSMDTVISSLIPSFDITSSKKYGGEFDIEDLDRATGYGILFIDEFSRLPEPSLVNAIMSLVTDRHVGEQYMGTHWAVVLATNPGSMSKSKLGIEKEIINDLLTDDAKIRRFQFVNFCPKFEEWLEWAQGIGHVNKMVINYLSQPQFRFHWFNSFDYIPSGEHGSTATPALWKQLSDELDMLEEAYDLTNVSEAKEALIEISQFFQRNMPYEEADGVEYFKNELIDISTSDCENMWTNPKDVAVKKDDGTSIRKINNKMGRNGNGLMINPESFANKIYSACPIRIKDFADDKDAIKFMNGLEAHFDNVSEFIDYFFSKDGAKLNNPLGGTSIIPYQTEKLFNPMKKTLVLKLAELFAKDMEKIYDQRVTKTDLFINGRIGGKQYPISKYFSYLLDKSLEK